MGLGKTRQSIIALRHAEPEGPYLVVCPASVKRNWEKEIHVVDAGAVCRIIQGSAEEGLPDGFTGWVIINYDILGKWLPKLLPVDWKGILFDEAHYLKNHASQRNRHAMALSHREDSDPVVYALTGTPLTNRPRDIFPLLQLVGHSMGKSFLSFAKRYCAAEHNGYGWVTDGASNHEEPTVQLQGVMLRRRKEVLDRPPKVRTLLPVEITSPRRPRRRTQRDGRGKNPILKGCLDS
jgi:SWI/SNF-related matrix-associated actin-dependent regulator 1 of chromatin subfamily A